MPRPLRRDISGRAKMNKCYTEGFNGNTGEHFQKVAGVLSHAAEMAAEALEREGCSSIDGMK